MGPEAGPTSIYGIFHAMHVQCVFDCSYFSLYLFIENSVCKVLWGVMYVHVHQLEKKVVDMGWGM